MFCLHLSRACLPPAFLVPPDTGVPGNGVTETPVTWVRGGTKLLALSKSNNESSLQPLPLPPKTHQVALSHGLYPTTESELVEAGIFWRKPFRNMPSIYELIHLTIFTKPSIVPVTKNIRASKSLSVGRW